jgi:hypothetical protein
MRNVAERTFGVFIYYLLGWHLEMLWVFLLAMNGYSKHWYIKIKSCSAQVTSVDIEYFFSLLFEFYTTISHSEHCLQARIQGACPLSPLFAKKSLKLTVNFMWSAWLLPSVPRSTWPESILSDTMRRQYVLLHSFFKRVGERLSMVGLFICTGTKWLIDLLCQLFITYLLINATDAQAPIVLF